jgi:hypothetical protein
MEVNIFYLLIYPQATGKNIHVVEMLLATEHFTLAKFNCSSPILGSRQIPQLPSCC